MSEIKTEIEEGQVDDSQAPVADSNDGDAMQQDGDAISNDDGEPLIEESKPKETAEESIKVYVGNLNYDQSQDELEKLFGTFGEITECLVMKGFSFIHFKKMEDAKIAIKKLNGTKFGGRTLKVEVSRQRQRGNTNDGNNGNNNFSNKPESKNLFVAGLSMDITDDEFVAIFETFGKVEGVHLHPKRSNQPARSGFVDFAELECARTAHNTDIQHNGQVLKTDYNIKKRKKSFNDNRNNYNGGNNYNNNNGGGNYGNNNNNNYGRNNYQQRGGYQSRNNGGYQDRGRNDRYDSDRRGGK